MSRLARSGADEALEVCDDGDDDGEGQGSSVLEHMRAYLPKVGSSNNNNSNIAMH